MTSVKRPRRRKVIQTCVVDHYVHQQRQFAHQLRRQRDGVRVMIRRTVLPCTAALALIAAGMVAVSGPALAADTATINGAAPTGFTLNGTACSL
jgi:hypothetical protein